MFKLLCQSLIEPVTVHVTIPSLLAKGLVGSQTIIRLSLLISGHARGPDIARVSRSWLDVSIAYRAHLLPEIAWDMKQSHHCCKQIRSLVQFCCPIVVCCCWLNIHQFATQWDDSACIMEGNHVILIVQCMTLSLLHCFHTLRYWPLYLLLLYRRLFANFSALSALSWSAQIAESLLYGALKYTAYHLAETDLPPL